MLIQTHMYENSPIQFEVVDGRVMANATMMAKPFGKRLSHWLENQSTKEYLVELINSSCRNSDISDNQLVIANINSENLAKVGLVVIKQGSSQVGGGTWIHEELIIELARWLNPKFSLWCNRVIAELLKTGKVEMKQPTTMVEALELALEAAKKVEEQQKLLEAQKPKVEFYEAVTASDDAISIKDMATLLYDNGIEVGQNRLFSILREEGFLIKAGARKNSPMQRFVEQGLFKASEVVINMGNATSLKVTTKVTGKGQEYLLNYFKNK